MTHEPSILVVDDDEAVLFAFSRIFRKSGVAVDTATTVGEAKARIDAATYTLVLTDLRLEEKPSSGGLQVIRYVKQRSPATKTVLWTAYDTEDDTKDWGCEADYVLAKPAPSERIKEILSDAVGSS